MSLLGLNANKAFSGTATAFPLRGFRALRAARFFTVNTPKPPVRPGHYARAQP